MEFTLQPCGLDVVEYDQHLVDLTSTHSLGIHLQPYGPVESTYDLVDLWNMTLTLLTWCLGIIPQPCWLAISFIWNHTQHLVDLTSTYPPSWNSTYNLMDLRGWGSTYNLMDLYWISSNGIHPTTLWTYQSLLNMLLTWQGKLVLSVSDPTG